MYVPKQLRSNLGQYNVFNPPAYYQSMATDPTQVPVQYLPYGGGVLWPGFYYGQRSFTAEDADRYARERQQYMEQRAQASEVPEYKYISPDRSLTPEQRKLFANLQAKQNLEQKKQAEIATQSKVINAVLAGTLLSALLRRL